MDLFLVLTYPKELDGIRTTLDKNILIQSFNVVFRDIFRMIRNISIVKSFINISIFSGYFRAIKDYLQPLLF